MIKFCNSTVKQSRCVTWWEDVGTPVPCQQHATSKLPASAKMLVDSKWLPTALRSYQNSSKSFSVSPVEGRGTRTDGQTCHNYICSFLHTVQWTSYKVHNERSRKWYLSTLMFYPRKRETILYRKDMQEGKKKLRNKVAIIHNFKHMVVGGGGLQVTPLTSDRSFKSWTMLYKDTIEAELSCGWKDENKKEDRPVVPMEFFLHAQNLQEKDSHQISTKWLGSWGWCSFRHCHMCQEEYNGYMALNRFRALPGDED